ncbi:hypothetical protein E2C01_006533 [Portunus trituberculatus]|uniref:Uncharacterized protein n=1 Tax=Portunus trituberculatus TaxID=210409 RepID=A0A5B7CVC0_PORTR|nr:hypothetical protein [Portunus trituberculatus]
MAFLWISAGGVKGNVVVLLGMMLRLTGGYDDVNVLICAVVILELEGKSETSINTSSSADSIKPALRNLI